mmetsp:Transcript_121361/g.387965  ORF Transcript_121361/g.387965 Transcript_121361/m.387965 type:complete len:359 (-) Transcript_121361:361-1437(-)
MEVRSLGRYLVGGLGNTEALQPRQPILTAVQSPPARPSVERQGRVLSRHHDAQRGRLQGGILLVVGPSILHDLQTRSAHRRSSIQLKELVEVWLVAGRNALCNRAWRAVLEDLRLVDVQVREHATGREHTRDLPEKLLTDLLRHLVCHLTDSDHLQGSIGEATRCEVQAVAMHEVDRHSAVELACAHLLEVLRDSDEVIRQVDAGDAANAAELLEGPRRGEGRGADAAADVEDPHEACWRGLCEDLQGLTVQLLVQGIKSRLRRQLRVVVQVHQQVCRWRVEGSHPLAVSRVVRVYRAVVASLVVRRHHELALLSGTLRLPNSHPTLLQLSRVRTPRDVLLFGKVAVAIEDSTALGQE